MNKENELQNAGEFGVKPASVDKSLNTPKPILLSKIQQTRDNPEHETILTQHLLNLKDEHSSYQSVLRACTFLNLAISTEHENVVSDDILIQSRVLHIRSYVEQKSSITSTLSYTISNHNDRRSRILAITTLSNLANQALLTCVPTPKLMTDDDVSLITRLQDEICNDVVLNLANCALEDDDGVAMVSFEALSSLVCDVDLFDIEVIRIMGHSSFHASGADNHEFYDEKYTYEQMKANFVSKYQDYDFPYYHSELKKRMVDSVLMPRARKLLCRMQEFRGLEYKARSLPLMNRIVMNCYRQWQIQNESPDYIGLDRVSFAKRWFEYDIDTMLQEYINTHLCRLLGLQDTSEGRMNKKWFQFSVIATSEAVRLLYVLKSDDLLRGPLASMTLTALESLLANISVNENDDRFMHIAIFSLIAMRSIPFERRSGLLSLISGRVISKISSSATITNPTLSMSDNRSGLPGRFCLWTEIAMSFFLPSSESDSSSDIVKLTLSRFLQNESIASIIDSTDESKSFSEALEEIIYSFCSVAYCVGRNTFQRENSGADCKRWIHCSVEILTAFMPFLGQARLYGDRGLDEPDNLEGGATLYSGAQRAFLELLYSILNVCGLVPSPSLYKYFIKSMDVASNPTAKVENIVFPLDISTENSIIKVLDDLLKLCKETYSVTARLSLLSILCDTWVCRCRDAMDDSRISSRQLDDGPVDVDDDITTINETQARSLLSLLGSEIATLIIGEKRRHIPDSSEPTQDISAMIALRSLLLCIACVESICYSAQLAANFFSTLESYADEEESARYIVSICQVVLKGQGKIDIDSMDSQEESLPMAQTSPEKEALDSPPRSPNSRSRITAFTSECSQAATRIRNFIGDHDEMSDAGDLNLQPIDFNCLCPLMKRPHFGLGTFNEKDASLANAIWEFNHEIALVPSISSKSSPSLNILLESSTSPMIIADRNHELFLSCRRVISHQSSLISASGATIVPGLFVNRNINNSSTSTQEVTFASPCVVVSGSSDPLEVSMTYSVRNTVENHVDSPHSIIVSVEIHNKTPISIENGISVHLSVKPLDLSSSFRSKGLWVNIEKEICSDDRFICEFIFFTWPIECVQLTPTIILKDLQVEQNPMIEVATDSSVNLSDESKSSQTTLQDMTIECQSILTPPDLALSSNRKLVWKESEDPILFTNLWMSLTNGNVQKHISGIHLPGKLPSLCSDKVEYLAMTNITSKNCILVQTKSDDDNQLSFTIKTKA
jgi:hypothetical protein